MKAHTVVLFRAVTGFEKTEDFTTAFRLPVLGFSVNEADGTGSASFDGSGLTGEDRDYMSTRLYDFYRMVASPEASETDDPRSIVRNRIGEVRSALDALEKELSSVPASDPETAHNDLFNAAETLSHSAEQLAFALYSWDAEQPSMIDAAPEHGL